MIEESLADRRTLEHVMRVRGYSVGVDFMSMMPLYLMPSGRLLSPGRDELHNPALRAEITCVLRNPDLLCSFVRMAEAR